MRDGHILNAAADYLVSQVVPGTDDVVIGLDAFGFQNDEDAVHALHAISAAVMRQTRLSVITLCFYSDDEVKKTKLIHRHDLAKWDREAWLCVVGVHGTGGASVDAVLKYTKSCYRNAEVFILTDGRMFNPQNGNDMKIGWLLSTHDNANPSYLPGVKVFTDDDRYLMIGNGPNLWENA